MRGWTRQTAIAMAMIASWLPGAAAAQTAVERTPHLSVEFRQDGNTVPLTPAETENGQQIYVVTLRAEPFEVSLPTSAWAPEDSNRYVAVGISADPAFVNHLHVGQGVYETDFLGAFRAMAYDPSEPGGLLTASGRCETASPTTRTIR